MLIEMDVSWPGWERLLSDVIPELGVAERENTCGHLFRGQRAMRTQPSSTRCSSNIERLTHFVVTNLIARTVWLDSVDSDATHPG
jgi:hypothetical protein